MVERLQHSKKADGCIAKFKKSAGCKLFLMLLVSGGFLGKKAKLLMATLSGLFLPWPPWEPPR
jgi:hypothetical protein